jgi:hypothetical protein
MANNSVRLALISGASSVATSVAVPLGTYTVSESGKQTEQVARFRVPYAVYDYRGLILALRAEKPLPNGKYRVVSITLPKVEQGITLAIRPSYLPRGLADTLEKIGLEQGWLSSPVVEPEVVKLAANPPVDSEPTVKPGKASKAK